MRSGPAMTVFSPAAGARPIGQPNEESRFGPAEGWTAVGLLALMLVMFARAVDDANWAGQGPDGRSQTGFLNWVVLLGGAYGLAAAKSRLSPLGAHVLGALLATIAIFVAVSGAISAAPTLDLRLDDMVASLGRFYHDLIVEGIRSRETSAFLLVLAAIGWTTGYFAAFTLFRRRRVLNAILITGLAMLAQVSLTIEAQYSYLVVFAAAGLLLIVRLNLLEQREGWVRRRIGDAGDVNSMYLRSGVSLVVGALIGAVLLAAYASSAPLAPVWRDADSDIVRLGHEVNRIVGGVTGAARGPSGLFGSTQTIRGFWESSQSVVFRSTSSDGKPRYWRAASYDAFDGQSWFQRDRDRDGVRVVAGDDLLEPTAELATTESPTGRTEVSTTVVAVDYVGRTMLAPDAAISVDRPADVFTHAGGGALATIDLADDLRTGDTYTVNALVPVEGEENGGLTVNQLAAAGVSYPGWVRRYIEIQEGAIGPATGSTARAIVAELPQGERDPAHIAFAIQEHFYGSGLYRYNVDVRGLCAGGEPLVDCFLRTRAGYCEYFATAMTMMLRTQSIPARTVMGFLPGRKLENGSWQVDRSAAHAWVEVFFPRLGWVAFDPTPGNRENSQRPTVLDEGAPIATPGAVPTPTFADDDSAIRPDQIGADPRPGGGGPLSNATGDQLRSVVVLVALGLGLLLLAFVLRRRVSETPGAEIAYAGMARLAGRFGYGPRPTETAYEYAASLGSLVPAIRDDLRVVATAKVEATYARRPPIGEMLERLRRAYRRVQVWLFALALRRLGRGKVGREESRRFRLRAR